MIPLKEKAISATLNGNWSEALAINEEILATEPKDIDTLNRLAFAYTILGKTKEAKATYQKVLEIDSANPIAQKNLKRLGTSNKAQTSLHISTNMFLEESGKTKIVTLTNTAPVQVIKTLQMGQLLHLCIKRSKIFVQDDAKQYIGMLPDDIGRRLTKFLEGGNAYSSYVKSARDHEVVIFIRETTRAKKFKDQPSFLFGDKTKLALTSTKKAAQSSRDEEEGE